MMTSENNCLSWIAQWNYALAFLHNKNEQVIISKYLKEAAVGMEAEVHLRKCWAKIRHNPLLPKT
jgi:hypothetical protein